MFFFFTPNITKQLFGDVEHLSISQIAAQVTKQRSVRPGLEGILQKSGEKRQGKQHPCQTPLWVWS